MQCYSTAATTMMGAAGLRVWLAAHRPAWLTARRMGSASGALLALGVLAAGLIA